VLAIYNNELKKYSPKITPLKPNEVRVEAEFGELVVGLDPLAALVELDKSLVGLAPLVGLVLFAC
ncbi:hypothetical protein K7432_017498, partial [Basidiobolus ranarum]